MKGVTVAQFESDYSVIIPARLLYRYPSSSGHPHHSRAVQYDLVQLYCTYIHTQYSSSSEQSYRCRLTKPTSWPVTLLIIEQLRSNRLSQPPPPLRRPISPHFPPNPRGRIPLVNRRRPPALATSLPPPPRPHFQAVNLSTLVTRLPPPLIPPRVKARSTRVRVNSAKSTTVHPHPHPLGHPTNLYAH